MIFSFKLWELKKHDWWHYLITLNKERTSTSTPQSSMIKNKFVLTRILIPILMRFIILTKNTLWHKHHWYPCSSSNHSHDLNLKKIIITKKCVCVFGHFLASGALTPFLYWLLLRGQLRDLLFWIRRGPLGVGIVLDKSNLLLLWSYGKFFFWSWENVTYFFTYLILLLWLHLWLPK